MMKAKHLALWLVLLAGFGPESSETCLKPTHAAGGEFGRENLSRADMEVTGKMSPPATHAHWGFAGWVGLIGKPGKH